MNNNLTDYLEFLDNSPTAYHAVAESKRRLQKAGFTELNPAVNWELKAGGKYFVVRNKSALIAFIPGSKIRTKELRIIAAHTDSPALKIKPDPIIEAEEQYLLNTEVYGGPILNTWYDRDLSLAGKVVLKDKTAFSVTEKLVDFKEAIAVIPNLAIHLNREINDQAKIDKIKGLRAIFSQPLAVESAENDNKPNINKLIADFCQLDPDKILAADLYLYPVEKARLIGSNKEYIAAGRQDNLAMVHTALTALSSADVKPWTQMAVFYDNEEIGSNTPQGADSPFVTNLIKRIADNFGLNSEEYYQLLEKSILLSADMAHAVHPNFADQYDLKNKVKLNHGPVLKYNANLNYTTHASTAAILINLMQANQISYQNYTNRTDKKGGSTIGPISATQLGIKSLDLGNSILAMHSARELGGVADHLAMIKLMSLFYRSL
ncbi:M18 family aminopeptidase [Halanaerobium salsuginis]|jgi:aspartyl aminopeptidase|uniref:M18 family aminopeptidase n=1 Tax=Halanaerobium salsuginis TaxID=29563 RepID=A0A1I4FA10_9FIRM|nr:M18 family aminopeptidase [Halanaerobium salsuginis]SFL13646.1 aspartyl aminopeptidase [Halanaerobium salsuginis]